MKLYKLYVHQKNFSDEDLVFSPKDFPDLKVNDVVEIYNPKEQNSRLLLQVKAISEDFQQKDSISVAQSIASNTIFQLRMYQDVYVCKVETRDVALDLVELTYKEQYFSRADMWGFKKSLVNSCVYMTQKATFREMRVQVEELWSKGDKVACGLVTEDTRVTFRSLTAQVNIFIQMSSEMWQFDNFGDLYFEKTVSGYLVDLFSKWKKTNCNHDVTITLFSRTFYDAKSIEEFPMLMRECVQLDHKGRFFEDFYRVVVQNERYDDWTSRLIELKQLFNKYHEHILQCHAHHGASLPRAWNSYAAQGNFLETLNMALNVFEKYYIDRNFDRTGKLVVVITPGPGVFEVDRHLMNITKQRTIDCGNSSDLVCMGEQPLHAVPLFKFCKKKSLQGRLDEADEYHIPHWINHSFYTSRQEAEMVKRGKFVPRVRIPQEQHKGIHNFLVPTSDEESSSMQQYDASTYALIDDVPFVDYDEYDAQVFKFPTYRSRKSSAVRPTANLTGHAVRKQRIPRIALGEDVSNLYAANEEVNQPPGAALSSPINIPQPHSKEFMPHSYGGKGVERKEISRASSVGSPVGYQRYTTLYNQPRRRALINPFQPSHLHFKVTSNRRRWAHAFPIDLRGASVQMHHQSLVTQAPPPTASSSPTRDVILASQLAVEHRLNRSRVSSESSDQSFQHSFSISADSDDSLKDERHLGAYGAGSYLVPNPGSGGALKKVRSGSALSLLTAVDSSASMSSMVTSYEREVPKSAGSRLRSTFPGLHSRTSSMHCDLSHAGVMTSSGIAMGENRNWLWGVTGEQPWTPEVKTGMDWKSMTVPASLPITTDYFPDKDSLQKDYVMSEYALLPEDTNVDRIGSEKKHQSTVDVYRELVAQRIAQGFQIVILPRTTPPPSAASTASPYQGSIIRARSRIQPSEEIILSIGRIFHKLTLQGHKIFVTRYWPRHPMVASNPFNMVSNDTFHYTYRFQVPDSTNYDVSWTDFSSECLERHKWNHIDLYLITRGADDSTYTESFKYWQARFLLLPSNNMATRKIIDGSKRCDIYEERSPEEQQFLIDGFLRFMETANKIRRNIMSRGHKKELSRRSSLTISPATAMGYGLVGMDKQDSFPRGGAPSGDVGNKGKGSPLISSASFAGHSSVIDPKKSMITPTSNDSGIVNTAYTNIKSSHDVTPEKMTRDGKPLLARASPPALILEAMSHAQEGLSFLRDQPMLPALCFVAAEAVTWLCINMEGVGEVDQAVSILQGLVDELYICHASSNTSHRFIYGFYLFFIVPERDRKSGRVNPLPGLYFDTSFQHYWCEVAVHTNDKGSQLTPEVALTQPDLLSQHVKVTHEEVINGAANRHGYTRLSESPTKPSTSSSETTLTLDLSFIQDSNASASHKTVSVDVDPNNKSVRDEWGLAHYHAVYTPTAAFQLVLHWLVATGCILGDLVLTWARKANTCGFHFLPVPCDPFALPFTPDSDPLRGPIFVPLNLDCLHDSGHDLFEDFPLETHETRLRIMQVAILKRFGFMPDQFHDDKSYAAPSSDQAKYVHCSGGMFVMIPDTKTSSPRNKDGTHCRMQHSSSLSAYIAMQRCHSESLRNSKNCKSYYQVGYLWSWNFMLTKRWRSSNTGDEAFQDKMLADFRAFCSNKENRLRDFWDSCYLHCADVVPTEEEAEGGIEINFSQ